MRSRGYAIRSTGLHSRTQHMERYKALGIIRAACVKSNPLRWATLTNRDVIEAFEQRIRADDIRVAVAASSKTEDEARARYGAYVQGVLQNGGNDDLESLPDEVVVSLADSMRAYVENS